MRKEVSADMVSKPKGGKLSAYIELTRPHNLLVAALTTLIGYITVIKAINAQLSPVEALEASLPVVLVAAAGYVVNDYYDVGTDAIAKPWRPIPSGRVSKQEALALSTLLFIAGFMASLPLGGLVAAFVLVNIVSVYSYSAFVKRAGFVGNIVVALNSSATMLMGALVACTSRGYHCPPLVALPFSVSFLLVLGREIVKGIEDYYGDMAECYMTLAVRLGPTAAAKVAIVLLALTITASILPLITPFYGTLYGILAALTDLTIMKAIWGLWRAASSGDTAALIETSRHARSVLKLSFALGGLALLLGPIW